MSSTVAEPVVAELKALMDAANTKDLRAFMNKRIASAAQGEELKGILAYISTYLQETVRTKGAEHIKKISAEVRSLPGLRSTSFIAPLYNIFLVTAECCLQAKDYNESMAVAKQYLTAPPSAEMQMRPEDQLRCATCLLRASTAAHREDMADFAATRSLRLYAQAQYAYQRDPTKAISLALLVEYLHALGASFSDRHLFGDASKVYYDIFCKLKTDTDSLQRSVVCALLCEAGPKRQRQLAVLHMEPAAHKLGPLWAVFLKAYRALILDQHDVAVLSGAAADVPPAILQRAVVQNNILAVSQIYTNISVPALVKMLGCVTEAQLVEIIVQMASEKHIGARLDQTEGWLYFNVFDSYDELSQWDEKLGDICNTVSYVSELIGRHHPELTGSA
ncbi:COP9 signalosome complex subunit 4 [Strigomonas culicis]|uniref:COP9 signalosome complex subunit 4 n=1 Tax=Strigomonas culicis TaxID=28005 RepID=S9TEY7_9TRYP|nr:COP9 signalosome complex subunit 4 [Strigomonas culicis]|eukprot:EPY15504.1 COP9 signalosome complex subunit 4 [Strigomonas culicis]